MLKIPYLTAVLLCCAINLSYAQGQRDIKVGMDVSYKPWGFTETSGAFAGFDIDLTADLCARIKLNCEIVAQSFDGLIPSLQTGKLDVIISAMTITPKRQEAIDFSIPYADSPRVLLTLKDSRFAELELSDKVFDIANADPEVEAQIEMLRTALKGAVVGVQGSTATEQFLTQRLGDVVEVRQYKTAEQYVLDLAAGRIDVAMDNLAYLGGIVSEERGKDMVIVGPKLSGGEFGSGRGVGFRKDSGELKASFDEAIEQAKKDGSISRLSVKWFGTDITP